MTTRQPDQLDVRVHVEATAINNRAAEFKAYIDQWEPRPYVHRINGPDNDQDRIYLDEAVAVSVVPSEIGLPNV
jgi:hypothetical protein